MTHIFLIRHGTHDWLAKGIAGRAPDVFLNQAGRAEAEEVGFELAKLPEPLRIRALYSSPIERTIETSQLVGKALALPVTVDDAFIEIDYGLWTAKTFAELNFDPLWSEWNERRSSIRIPGGETIQEVQNRVIGGIFSLSQIHPFQAIAIVSHGDPIKCVLAYCGYYALDHLASHHIRAASISLISVSHQRIHVAWHDKVAEEILGHAVLFGGE